MSNPSNPQKRISLTENEKFLNDGLIAVCWFIIGIGLGWFLWG